MEFIIENDYVYKITKDKAYIKANIGNLNNLQINNNNNTIEIKYQTFSLDENKYVIDKLINKTINIYISKGEYANIDTVDIVYGEGVYNLNETDIGTYKIEIDNAECEVVVNG